MTSTSTWRHPADLPRVAVIYHSRRGTMHRLAVAAAEGAAAHGAQVRLLRVADEGPGPSRPRRHTGADPEHPVASPEDVRWADGLVLATPTYFGNVSAPFKRFLDSTSRLWARGLLADRVVTAMTSAECDYGGREATLLSLYQTAWHWGSWVLGADLADLPHLSGPGLPRTGGNPYGLSVRYRRGEQVSAPEVEAARAQGARLAEFAARTPRLRGLAAPRPMRGPARVTVVHHARHEAVRVLAQECAAGARELGAEVRLRRVPEATTASGGMHSAVKGPPSAPPATERDLEWADAVVFGSLARLGAPAAALVDFLQRLPEGVGPLTEKAASSFVVTPRPHSGSESALLAFHHLLFHGGAVVAPPGYTDPASLAAGGNPYGSAHALSHGALPGPAALEAVRYQGQRAAVVGDLLRRTDRAPYRPQVPGTREELHIEQTQHTKRTQHTQHTQHIAGKAAS
ncbi:flavodoxin family protein [Streptomyces sp. NPDC021093]|uniref:flavodoxin family protein n=1 Tax=Streptomyces sp. NPDC021093 TaxID=3365112 RepID=UPI0037A29D92